MSSLDIQSDFSLLSDKELSSQNTTNDIRILPLQTPEHKTKLEWWKNWRCGVLIFSILLCALTTANTIYISVKTDQSSAVSGKSKTTFSDPVCLQCIKLIKNPFNYLEPDLLVDKLLKRVDEGIQMCCAENNEQLSALIEASLREQVTKSIPRLNGSASDTYLTPVSAHKQLLPNELTDLQLKNASAHFVVRFNKEYHDPLVEHARGVTVLDTALKIKHTGMYYIYLSVLLAPNLGISGKPCKVKNLYQYVHRVSPNSPANSGVLLEATLAGSHDCSGHPETAFAGGSFNLKKDDHIEVCLSEPSLVRYRKESTYVGLFLMSTAEDGHNRF